MIGLTLALTVAASAPSSAEVAGLLGAWGTSDIHFDYNGDGTVNAQDLAMLLGAGDPDPAPPPAHAPGVVVRYGEWIGVNAAGNGQAIEIRVSLIRAVYSGMDGTCTIIYGCDPGASLIVCDADMATVMGAIWQ